MVLGEERGRTTHVEESKTTTDDIGGNKVKHIALFTKPLFTGGGVTRALLNLARAFTERGYRVDFVVDRAKGPYLREIPQSVRVIDLHARTALTCLPFLLREPRMLWGLMPVLFNLPRVIGSLPALVHYLQRERPMAMLAAKHYENITALCAVRLAGVQTRLTISQRTHLTRDAQQGTKRRDRLVHGPVGYFYPWADNIIAVSDGVADDLSLCTGIPRERIRTIYNPVVTPELLSQAQAPLDHPWFAPGSPPVILGVGRFNKQKDFPTLLWAFARVRAVREARLIVLGEGKKRPELEELVQQLGISPDVALPGFVLNPFSYMARASVFALSSAWEGISNALIEALACGCPVVSTDCHSGPAEVLDGGRYGPLVPVGDDAALAQAILTVLETPPDRDRLRARSAEFSRDRAVEQYLEVLLGEKQ